jgi:hypothetical protein
VNLSFVLAIKWFNVKAMTTIERRNFIYRYDPMGRSLSYSVIGELNPNPGIVSSVHEKRLGEGTTCGLNVTVFGFPRQESWSKYFEYSTAEKPL